MVRSWYLAKARDIKVLRRERARGAFSAATKASNLLVHPFFLRCHGVLGYLLLALTVVGVTRTPMIDAFVARLFPEMNRHSVRFVIDAAGHLVFLASVVAGLLGCVIATVYRFRYGHSLASTRWATIASWVAVALACM